VPDVRGAGDRGREAADCDETPSSRHLGEEKGGGFDLVARRPPIAIRATRLVRMCRNHVPEQHVLLEAELGEHAVDDRRRRLRGPAAGELTLGRERDAADPRSPVAGGLADEQDPCVAPGVEVSL
jgi:hypothetical protein